MRTLFLMLALSISSFQATAQDPVNVRVSTERELTSGSASSSVGRLFPALSRQRAATPAGATEVLLAVEREQIAPRVGLERPVATLALTALARQQSPAVASDGKDFLVVWMETQEATSPLFIYAARFDARGFPLGSRILLSEKAVSNAPDVAFDGLHYTVIWSEKNGLGLSEVVGVHVTTAGTLLEHEPFRVRGFSKAILACSPSNCLVADYRQFARLAHSGELLEPAVSLDPLQSRISAGMISSFNWSISEVDWDGSQYLLGLGVVSGVVSPPDPGGSVFGLRVGTDGSLGNIFQLSDSVEVQSAVASNGEKTVSLLSTRNLVSLSVTRKEWVPESLLHLGEGGEGVRGFDQQELVWTGERFVGFWTRNSSERNATRVNGVSLRDEANPESLTSFVVQEAGPLLYSLDAAANAHGQVALVYGRAEGPLPISRVFIRLISFSSPRSRVHR